MGESGSEQNQKMDGDDVVKHLIITKVKFTNRVLGRGSYRRVDCNGMTCAAKEIHPILVEGVSRAERSELKQNFL